MQSIFRKGAFSALWLALALFSGACGEGEETCPAGQVQAPDGTCQLGCVDTGLTCLNGVCVEGADGGSCVCSEGHVGVRCESCADGFQDNDGDGTCSRDCGTAGLSCGAGACDDSSGVATCKCPDGLVGESCERCAPGFQDHDGDGVCLPNCESAGIECGSGACSDSSGVAVCECPEGYAGEHCSSCAAGFQNRAGDGICRPDCGLAGLQCGRGVCNDSSGVPTCKCPMGYEGESCEECAEGFQDHDGDGRCLPDCLTAALSCGHGVCDDTSGIAACVCEQGYIGESCGSCAPGYRELAGDGICYPTCPVAGLDCGAGQCDDSGGIAVCTCASGHTGSSCQECAAGFQDHDKDGVCRPGCDAGTISCLHGSCDDSTGSAACVCEEGYEGASCHMCAPGFQDRDLDGVCLPGCSMVSLGCVHGFCDESTGAAVCACEEGYQGERCDTCQVGYSDPDQDGVCVPGCAVVNPDCGQGQCVEDGTGAPSCLCDEGYAGAGCLACAPGFQDNDLDGACEPTCETSGLSCSNETTCRDWSGTATCVPYPETCADIRDLYPNAPEWIPYELYVGRDPARPWLVRCEDLATEPKEYLDSPFRVTSRGERIDGRMMWTATDYSGLRIDPRTLRLDVNDTRLAFERGSGSSGGFAPLGSATSCSEGEDALAWIEIGFSRFRIVDTYFCPVGPDPEFSVTWGPGYQTVELTGRGLGGTCGGVVPSLDPTCSGEPKGDGWDVQLEYVPCPAGTEGVHCDPVESDGSSTSTVQEGVGR